MVTAAEIVVIPAAASKNLLAHPFDAIIIARRRRPRVKHFSPCEAHQSSRASSSMKNRRRDLEKYG